MTPADFFALVLVFGAGMAWGIFAERTANPQPAPWRAVSRETNPRR